MRAFEYRHVVGFEETNLVGNVYYVNLLRWQGRCRELFLREHVPEILEELGRGCCLVTLHCSCDFLAELAAFDEVVVRMRFGGRTQNRIRVLFEFWRSAPDGEELVARGEQRVACMRREGGLGGTMVPIPIPRGLRQALDNYAEQPVPR
jgi:enediyne biosynthesis thioesterase